MAFPEIYIDPAVHKRAEFQVGLIEKLCEHFPVEIVQIQDPDLTPERLHILNDLIGLLLPDRELVLIHTELLYHLDKRVYRECVMLHGNAEFLLHVLFLNISGFHQLILFRYLSRVA